MSVLYLLIDLLSIKFLGFCIFVFLFLLGFLFFLGFDCCFLWGCGWEIGRIRFGGGAKKCFCSDRWLCGWRDISVRCWFFVNYGLETFSFLWGLKKRFLVEVFCFILEYVFYGFIDVLKKKKKK